MFRADTVATKAETSPRVRWNSHLTLPVIQLWPPRRRLPRRMRGTTLPWLTISALIATALVTLWHRH